MAVSESQLKKIVSKYKYRDLTICEIVHVITLYKDLKPVLDSYVFNNGSSREIMNLSGTILVLWDTCSYNPPICFIKPTSSMTIKTGKQDTWPDLFIQVMIVVFGDEPPVFSRLTILASYPLYQAKGQPNTSYMPSMPSGISAYPSRYTPNPSGYPGCPYPPLVTPVATVSPNGDDTIGEVTIRASLISVVSDRLRWQRKEEMDHAQAGLNALKQTEEDLKKGDQKLEEMVTRLDQEVSENNDTDEVIIPTVPLYKQILNLYAEKNAIEDTIFYLGEALRWGVIGLGFQLGALMQKARKTANLYDLY
ncbi:unnamed protein product [Nyctereutes procyonoides]|uniref:(raccoon dog) hypothetical protein n=1 Tax=Nyctereutes procyonoides TaxID=34880 RepID=A0A811ZB58_NYCPR|nr:unnamed protein product [Nyctereutes procyonoides]